MINNDKSYKWDGCPLVKEVAESYFPQYEYSRTAISAFKRKIAASPKMLQELLEAEYCATEKHLTPKQMIIITTHWGKPGDLRLFLHLIDDPHTKDE